MCGPGVNGLNCQVSEMCFMGSWWLQSVTAVFCIHLVFLTYEIPHKKMRNLPLVKLFLDVLTMLEPIFIFKQVFQSRADDTVCPCPSCRINDGEEDTALRIPSFNKHVLSAFCTPDTALRVGVIIRIKQSFCTNGGLCPSGRGRKTRHICK